MDKGIARVVREILATDEKARDSDRYLYVEVVKKLNPRLAYEPLAIALASADIVCMESVRRARQLMQNKHPELRGSEAVQCMRGIKEEAYREYYGRKKNVH